VVPNVCHLQPRSDATSRLAQLIADFTNGVVGASALLSVGVV